MKRLKKLYSLILTLSMIASFPSAIMAEAETAAADSVATVEVNERVQEREAILSALGILPEKKDDEETAVTRSLYANAVVMMVMDELPNGKEECDLTASDSGLWYLKECGIVAGVAKDTYDPQGAISVGQAVKIAADMMGYSLASNYSGGYLDGYMKIASENGLLSGVSYDKDAELTYNAMVNLLYNVSECTVMEVNSIIGKGQVNYKKNEDEETLLSIYRSIYNDKGVVMSGEVSGLYNKDDKVKKNHLKINGRDMVAESFCSSDILGKNVRYYYRTGDDLVYDELLYAAPYKNSELSIRSCDLLYYDNGTYSYESSGRTKTINLKKDIITIYNGAQIADNTVFIPADGYVEFIDNDDDGKYDVLKIHDEKLVIVSGTITIGNSRVISDRFNTSYNITVDTRSDDYVVYDANGEKAAVSQITAGSVIGVETTAGTEPYTTIRIYNKTESNKLSTFDDEDKKLFLGDGKDYRTTHRFQELIDSKDIEMKYSENVTVYFNGASEAVYFEIESVEGPLSYRIGYVRRFKVDTETEENHTLRVFDESGKWRTFGFAEKVKIDGKTYKRAEADIVNVMNGTVGTLIKYMVDIHGDLKQIHLPAAIPATPKPNNVDEEFQTLLEGSARYKYYPGGYVFGNQNQTISVSPSLKLFMMPKAAGELAEEDIKIVTRSMFKDGSTYSVKLYSDNGIPGMATVGLYTTANSQKILSTAGNRPIAINKITQTINEDDEIIWNVNGMQNGSEVNVKVEDKRADQTNLPFKKGDVAYLIPEYGGNIVMRDDVVYAGTTETKGYSYGVLCTYDPITRVLTKHVTSNNDLPAGTWGLNFGGDTAYNENRTLVGKAYDADSNYLYVVTGSDASDWSKVQAFENINWGNVYVWDEAEEMFRNGSINEAKFAKYQGNNASNVYIIAHNQFQIIIIYP